MMLNFQKLLQPYQVVDLDDVLINLNVILNHKLGDGNWRHPGCDWLHFINDWPEKNQLYGTLARHFADNGGGLAYALVLQGET